MSHSEERESAVKTWFAGFVSLILAAGSVAALILAIITFEQFLLAGTLAAGIALGDRFSWQSVVKHRQALDAPAPRDRIDTMEVYTLTGGELGR